MSAASFASSRRPGFALLLAATVASCAYPAESEPSAEAAPSETGMRWISIDLDALDHAKAVRAERVLSAGIEPIEVAGRVAVLQFDEQDFHGLSQTMHARHGRCGGFMLHDTLEDARLALTAQEPVVAQAVAYTVDNAASVDVLLPALSEPNLRMVIEQLSTTFPSRYYTSTGGLAVPAWVRDLWAGYAAERPDVTVELFVHTGFEQRSVIATIPGSTKASEVIVIGGHIDSIASGGGAAPGADDDASGIATISEVLRVLMATGFRPQRTVKLIAYAAEEVGLRGSKGIVSAFKSKGVNVVGVMQLDMTNYQGSAKDIYLMQDFTNAAQNTFLGTLIDTYVGATWGTSECGYGCSDHAAWHNAGYAASMPAEAMFSDTNPNLHTPNDTLDASNNTATHATKFARLATAYVAELAKGYVAANNTAPTVSITLPAADQTVPAAMPIELAATAMDAEDGELSAMIQWSSSLDGALGSGPAQTASLSIGVHTITASVQDAVGAAGQATMSITVNVTGTDEDDDDDGGAGGCSAGGGAGLGVLGGLAVWLARRRRRREP